MTSRMRRPGLLRLLAAFFLFLSLLGWLRFVQALAGREWIAALGISPGWLYIALGGVLWGVVGLVTALVLWHGRTKAPLFSGVAIVVIVSSYWLDFLLIGRSSSASTLAPFWVGISVCSLLWVGMAVYWLYRRQIFIH